jgi:hypothetical protein
MTPQNKGSYLGPPPPVLELTMEQQFKLRRINDLLPEANKEDIITLFEALQHQNFVLSNTVSNLVKQWPNHHPLHTWNHRSMGLYPRPTVKLPPRQCY